MSFSEKNKEMLSLMINISTRVVTLIFLIASIILYFFFGLENVHWGLIDIWGILLIGLVSGAAFGIFYIKKNMSNKEIILLRIVYFLIINATLFIVAIKLGWINEESFSIISMEAMFIVIYILVNVLVYLFDFSEAKKINQKLKDRKKNTQ